MNAIFDLDGTLVDIWPRYFAVFRELTNGGKYSFAQYRAAKKKLRQDAEVAEALGTTLLQDYSSRKKLLLESDEMLALDELIISFDQFATWLDSSHGVILTKRRNRDSAVRQLANLGLLDLVDEVFILDPDAGKSKSEWAKERRTLASQEWDVVVGDGPEDAAIGRELNMEAIFVESGLNTFEYIRTHNPGVRSTADVNEFLFPDGR